MGLTSTIIDSIAWISLGWYFLMVSMAIFGSIVASVKYRSMPPPLPVLRYQPRSKTTPKTISHSIISTDSDEEDDCQSESDSQVNNQKQPSSSSSSSPSRSLASVSKPSNTLLPSVSILRPLCGLDFNLEENLESSFLLNWPNNRFELIFCSDEQDPSTDTISEILSRLIRRYPHVNAKLIKTNERVGVNPKINNLIQAYKTAQSDLIWILDSNILIHPNTLARSIELLDPPRPTQRGHRIGLVHHVPVGLVGPCQKLCWGGLLESCFLNTNHARQYLAINAIGVASCLVGKSNLFYRSDLQRACKPFDRHQEEIQEQQQSLRNNGRHEGTQEQSQHLLSSEDEDDRNGSDDGLDALKWFGQFVGEDNMIGQALWDDGIRHAISIDVVGNVVGNMDLKDYISRRIRWIRARKYMSFYSTLLEPLTESVLLGLLTWLSINRLNLISSSNSKYFLMIHETIYFVIDYSVYRSIMNTPLLKDISNSYPSTASTRSDPLIRSSTSINPDDDEDREHDEFEEEGLRVMQTKDWKFVSFKNFLIGWILREFLAFIIWIRAMVSDKVSWRKSYQSLRVLRDGRSIVEE